MSWPKFKELPFNSRPDLTPYLIHLTKSRREDEQSSAFQNLNSILKCGEIWGSDCAKAFIKGKRRATCFMDVPFSSLKYVLTPANADPEKPRYEPYGIVIDKQVAYDAGTRPVLHLSDTELTKLKFPEDELWRVVRLEVQKDRWICWLHEREWRCPEKFKLPDTIPAVTVRTSSEAANLRKDLERRSEDFKCIPDSIVPLDVVSQGLLA